VLGRTWENHQGKTDQTGFNIHHFEYIRKLLMEPAWNKWEDYSSGSGIQMKNQGLVDNQVLLQYILEKINGLGKIGCGRHITRMSIRKMGYFTLV